MNAAELIKSLNDNGIVVIPEGENLRVRGHLNDNMRKMLKVLKVEVREQLSNMPGSNVVPIQGRQDAEYYRQLAEDWAFFDQGATEQGREEMRLMHRGIVPKTFTDTFDCRHCGTVEAKPGDTNCRWCFVGGYRGGK